MFRPLPTLSTIAGHESRYHGTWFDNRVLSNVSVISCRRREKRSHALHLSVRATEVLVSVSVKMSLAKILLLVGLACCTGSSMPGGWTEQAPESNPEYLKLAHFAVSQQTSGRRYYDTVLELLRVETQVSVGVIRRHIFGNCLGRENKTWVCFGSTARPDCRHGGDVTKECYLILLICSLLLAMYIVMRRKELRNCGKEETACWNEFLLHTSFFLAPGSS